MYQWRNTAYIYIYIYIYIFWWKTLLRPKCLSFQCSDLIIICGHICLNFRDKMYLLQKYAMFITVSQPLFAVTISLMLIITKNDNRIIKNNLKITNKKKQLKNNKNSFNNILLFLN